MSSLQIRKLRLREASHHLRSPSLQAVQSLGPCLPRSWGGGHGPPGRADHLGSSGWGGPIAPLRLPCHPEHFNSGRREPPSPNPENRQPLRNPILGLKVDPVTGTGAAEGWAGKGSPSYLGRRVTGGALSNPLSPETLRGALEGRHDLGDPSEQRGPLDYALPRATVCRLSRKCWTGSALTAVLQVWALGERSGREPGAPAPFIQGHPTTSPTK